MEKLFTEYKVWIIVITIVVTIWEAVWTLIALWKSARNKHLVWFIVIGITNTFGIIPIIYLIKYKKTKGLKD